MEVINSINGTTQVCQASSHTYPLEVSISAGTLLNKTLIVCGGEEPVTAACYQFDQSHQWKKLSDMSTPKVGSASISITNGAWITGGSDEDSYELRKG